MRRASAPVRGTSGEDRTGSLAIGGRRHHWTPVLLLTRSVLRVVCGSAGPRPIDRATTGLAQELVGLAERLAAEEPLVSRPRCRVDLFDDAVLFGVDELDLLAGVSAPRDEHDGLVL